MKKVITLVLVFLSAICIGQNPQELEKAFFSKEQTEQLENVMEQLSQKLNTLQENDSYFTIQEMDLVQKALQKVENKVHWKVLATTLKQLESNTAKTKVSFSIDIGDSDGSSIQELADIDFTKLTEKLEDFILKFQKSPKFKELEASLVVLEEKLTKEDKN